MKDEWEWWSLLDQTPQSFPWFAFADWLEERGDARARAARRMGEEGRAPCRCVNAGKGVTWDWYESTGPWERAPQAACLPQHLMPGADDFRRFKTVREYHTASRACRALLDTLAADIALETPGPPG